MGEGERGVEVSFKLLTSPACLMQAALSHREREDENIARGFMKAPG
jgi:hypothetical protein